MLETGSDERTAHSNGAHMNSGFLCGSHKSQTGRHHRLPASPFPTWKHKGWQGAPIPEGWEWLSPGYSLNGSVMDGAPKQESWIELIQVPVSHQTLVGSMPGTDSAFSCATWRAADSQGSHRACFLRGATEWEIRASRICPGP